MPENGRLEVDGVAYQHIKTGGEEFEGVSIKLVARAGGMEERYAIRLELDQAEELKARLESSLELAR